MAILKSGSEELIRHYRNGKNRSYTYILPLLSLHKDELFIDKTGQSVIDLTKSLFLNCYLRDEAHPDMTNHIFLLYKFFGSREFIQFEKKLQSHPYYLESYDPYSNMVMFAFEVPAAIKSDYDLLLQGKYSMISDSTKDKIVDFHGVRAHGGKNRIVQILYKLEEAFLDNEKWLNEGLPKSQWVRIPRNQEATSIMDVEGDETFKHIAVEDRIQGNKDAEKIKGFGEEETENG